MVLICQRQYLQSVCRRILLIDHGDPVLQPRDSCSPCICSQLISIRICQHYFLKRLIKLYLYTDLLIRKSLAICIVIG